MGTVLSVSRLSKTYEVKKTAFSLKRQTIQAVDNVSFEVEKGKTLGIVGESGSGKSTLARCVLLLEAPDGGTTVFLGKNLASLKNKELREMRKQMQIIFQDPYSSLNPRRKVFEAIAEPLLFHKITKKRHIKEKVMEVLRKVGLDEDALNKYPHEMSGGQRQRVAIGRALATEPILVVADEPVSSLDVSIQAQIVNLFLDIKDETGISMLFISHDLNIIRFVADNVIVMYKGKVLEMGEKDEIFYRPLHPYTEMLVDSIKGEHGPMAAGSGSMTLPPPLEKEGRGDLAAHKGCDYYSRCNKRIPECEGETPELTGSDQHKVACFSYN